MWLLRRAADEPVAARVDRRERWKIRCFGRLRIYRNDGSQVKWDAPGGATRKTKTLFAYLLQKGGEGAATDELADLLWPEADKIETARNRLYHTVRCLRQALTSASSDGGSVQHVLRDGARYVLTPPQGSWLDISTFEQLCRQSQFHINAGATDEALICLQAADRLYTGDLFEDIPTAYADNCERDWCWSKRYWLRDMFFKIQRDAARIHRERQTIPLLLHIARRRWQWTRCARSLMKKRCKSSSHRGAERQLTGNTNFIWTHWAILIIDRRVLRSRQPIGSFSVSSCASFLSKNFFAR